MLQPEGTSGAPVNTCSSPARGGARRGGRQPGVASDALRASEATAPTRRRQGAGPAAAPYRGGGIQDDVPQRDPTLHRRDGRGLCAGPGVRSVATQALEQGGRHGAMLVAVHLDAPLQVPAHPAGAVRRGPALGAAGQQQREHRRDDLLPPEWKAAAALRTVRPRDPERLGAEAPRDGGPPGRPRPNAWGAGDERGRASRKAGTTRPPLPWRAGRPAGGPRVGHRARGRPPRRARSRP